MSTTINPNYQGLFEQCATFKCDDNVKEGSVVAMTENGTVGLASSTVTFCGVARAVRNGMCSVQLHGCVTLSYVGGSPGCGYCDFIGNENGEGLIMTTSGNTRSLLVLEVDPENCTCTVML